ncbi:MAG: hypothetical protein WCS87_17845 [Methylococcaceae bacterium]
MRLSEYISTPLLFFFIFAASIIAKSVYMPNHNWDMIPYIAAAKSFEEENLESLHSFTYDQLRHSVKEYEYKKMTTGDVGNYRYVISTDSSAFKEQLPFYKIRPVYTGLIYLLYKAGGNISFATHIISGVSVFIAVGILYLISTSFLATPLIFAVPFLAVIFGIYDLATLSTPDGLGFLACILSVYFYLKKYITLLLIILPIMIGIRTDFILFTIPLLFFVFLFERSCRWKTLLSILISVGIYIGIITYFKNPGWSTIFYFACIQPLIHPISIPPMLTASDYRWALFRGIKDLYSESFYLYLLLTTYSIYLINNHANKTSIIIALKAPSTILTIVCLITVVSHILILPNIEKRYYSPFYIISAFSFLVMMTRNLTVSDSAQQYPAPADDSAMPYRRQ